jgi:hypothetical protein
MNDDSAESREAHALSLGVVKINRAEAFGEATMRLLAPGD